MTITLRPDLEEELGARAQASGLSTEEFVNRELERRVASTQPSSKLSPEERVRLWREFMNSHDDIQAPPLSDEAERGLPLKRFLEAVIEINVGRGGDGHSMKQLPLRNGKRPCASGSILAGHPIQDSQKKPSAAKASMVRGKTLSCELRSGHQCSATKH